MKKILKFVLDRPEWDALFLGALLVALPLLFSNGTQWTEELLEAELPEWDKWPFFFLAGIPLGALISSLIGKKFKLLWIEGAGSKALAGIRGVLGNTLGGILTAAGCLLAGDILWNWGYSAVSFKASGWLFIFSMLIFSCTLSILWNNRTSAPKKKGDEK